MANTWACPYTWMCFHHFISFRHDTNEWVVRAHCRLMNVEKCGHVREKIGEKFHFAFWKDAVCEVMKFHFNFQLLTPPAATCEVIVKLNTELTFDIFIMFALHFTRLVNSMPYADRILKQNENMRFTSSAKWTIWNAEFEWKINSLNLKWKSICLIEIWFRALSRYRSNPEISTFYVDCLWGWFRISEAFLYVFFSFLEEESEKAEWSDSICVRILCSCWLKKEKVSKSEIVSSIIQSLFLCFIFIILVSNFPNGFQLKTAFELDSTSLFFSCRPLLRSNFTTSNLALFNTQFKLFGRLHHSRLFYLTSTHCSLLLRCRSEEER